MTADTPHPSGKTRFAPSPTGALHLGNARTFLVNHLLAVGRGWATLLRIEDLDGPRVKPHAAAETMDDLRWLGLNWNQGPVYQSARGPAYAAAVDALLRSGHAYPCVCTRKEVDTAASAPHAEDGSAIYPGTCRGRFPTPQHAFEQTGRRPAIRFLTDDRPVAWTDGFAGPRSYAVAPRLGDFVVAKADGTPAYQLAVVVDDAAADVSHVVRGDDLLDSTPRQILLYRALDLAGKIPTYFHLPLVTGTDGRRLAKRHGDSRLPHYRRLGVPRSRILRLLGRWIGIDGDTPDQLLSRFDLGRLPRGPIVYTANDEAELLRGL